MCFWFHIDLLIHLDIYNILFSFLLNKYFTWKYVTLLGLKALQIAFRVAFMLVELVTKEKSAILHCQWHCRKILFSNEPQTWKSLIHRERDAVDVIKCSLLANDSFILVGSLQKFTKQSAISLSSQSAHRDCNSRDLLSSFRQSWDIVHWHKYNQIWKDLTCCANRDFSFSLLGVWCVHV